MRFFNNEKEFAVDHLSSELHGNSKVSIAAACFSIYAFQKLQEQLENVSELRFIFTKQRFTQKEPSFEKKEFYLQYFDDILGGTEVELKLRNELSQKAIAKECADWIRKKVKFKTNLSGSSIPGFINVNNEDDNSTYFPVTGFTLDDLGAKKGKSAFNFITKLDDTESREYLKAFNKLWNDKTQMQDVTENVLKSLNVAYCENSPDFIYYLTLFHLFKEYLEEVSEDDLPNERVGLKESQIWNTLYHFQRDAALAIINKLETFNGCILADSVGLGKTFSALAVIKYYEERNKDVLVLCPKKLADNWNSFKKSYTTNPVAADRLRYDVLFHTDLTRKKGYSNGTDLARLRWDKYDLVVIDESHNFRNGGRIHYRDDQKILNRHASLMERILRPGVKTKVLMLSATPVNNRFRDLKYQLELAYEGDPKKLERKLKIKKSIDIVFREAENAFKWWSASPAAHRTADSLLSMLDFNFFELLDSVTIARSRKHISKYYDTNEIGRFPDRLPPRSLHPALTKIKSITYDKIYQILEKLTLSVYLPSMFVRKNVTLDEAPQSVDEQDGEREKMSSHDIGLHHLMFNALFKRLESSVYAFCLTVERILHLNENMLAALEKRITSKNSILENNSMEKDVVQAAEDDESDFTARIRKFDLQKMDLPKWRKALRDDIKYLQKLLDLVQQITPEWDNKLQILTNNIRDKIKKPINAGNKKIIIFTAFSDTARYLYEHISKFVMEEYSLHSALVTGNECRTTVPKVGRDVNEILTLFSPLSKSKAQVFPDEPAEIDILIATDCISEGQNLQDCDFLINYDIHWNPVRIIQRFGRIDRIGSANSVIQLVNFWPDMTLDAYIGLKSRVEDRMKACIISATGDENPIDQADTDELEYRKRQLERLQNEVVDLEEMDTGVTIMDLGLSDFRLDLLARMKANRGENKMNARGLYTVVPETKGCPPGVIYVLRNENPDLKEDKQNRLHPYYIVYLANDGTVICNHLETKRILTILRQLCKGRTEPDLSLCKAFNKETQNGKKMKFYSKLLGKAVDAVIGRKDEADIDSLFKVGGTTVLENKISGAEDFEIICFIVVK